nr:putative neural-cadherin 2 [Cherax quadricarinatus]
MSSLLRQYLELRAPYFVNISSYELLTSSISRATSSLLRQYLELRAPYFVNISSYELLISSISNCVGRKHSSPSASQNGITYNKAHRMPGSQWAPWGQEQRLNLCKHKSRSSNRVWFTLHLFTFPLQQVKAVDGDAGRHGHLTYSVSGDGIFKNGTRSCFSVHPTSGTVHLLRPLDRDPPHGRPQWRLRVWATDGELDAATDVRVNLKDINDNAPFFPFLTTHASVSEDAPPGSSVVRVVAVDHDDPQEADNAKVTYSLEKNAIDESTGKAIFAIDSNLGLITTAFCCLDREKTHRYIIQVVATDGGGLKGTGTVVIDVEDVNDVPPRFSQPEWTLKVSENLTPDDVLATLTVQDTDISNYFTFRVVPESGRGWELFRVEGRPGGGPEGDLRAVQPLDYEDPDHRRGFSFKVQVTDMGTSGRDDDADDHTTETWDDHTAETWVRVFLEDVNDNDPVFSENHAHLSLPEDTPPGTHLTTFTALDPDAGGEKAVTYSIASDSDPGRQFSVDGSGAVRVVGGMDREVAAAHTVLVWAVDQGHPPRTTTATLSVNVTDVNDNPPFLVGPQEVQVVENGEAQEVARVKLGDPDDWSRGHGPPFSVVLDPRAPRHVAANIKVTLDKRGDEGRGVGVVWARAGLDREERRTILVPLVVGDAGRPSLSATVTLSLQVADVNDNPMSPASKTVTVHTLQSQGEPVPLGRVYVRDPDDWDARQKTYSWRLHHPGFFLASSSGDLTMTPLTPDGRYELGFTVSDVTHGISDVDANVTVDVISVSLNDVIDATPITLLTDSYRLVNQDQDGGSILTRLVWAVRSWAEVGADVGVRAVSVQPLGQHTTPTPTPTTRVWLSSSGIANFGHVLLHRKRQLSKAIGVTIREVGVSNCDEAAHDEATHDAAIPNEAGRCVGGCWVSLNGGFNIVDANTSAVVGPRVTLRGGCGCGDATPAVGHFCTPHTCLNGGRCVPTSTGTRCVCPHGTWGLRCKILIRHFEGGGPTQNTESFENGMPQVGGWAWVSPIPPCTEVHVSLEILTKDKSATLLYSGADQVQQGNPGSGTVSIRDLLLLELRQGRPSLVLDLGDGLVTLTLSASYSLADNAWHRIDILWKDKQVELIVDLCSGGSIETPLTTAHDHSTPPTCRASSTLPGTARILNTGGPLQVGGQVHLNTSHLQGCIRNLRVNGQLVDLGVGVLSRRSFPGCPASNCRSSGLHCGLHGRCQGSPGSLRCGCQAGWSGPGCGTPTTPTTFLLNSYIKLALSFTPLGYTTSISLRFRTWRRSGQLVMLSSQHGRESWSLQLVEGHLCVLLQMVHTQPSLSSLCLSRASLSDGRWHYLAAVRYGTVSLLTVDDGDNELYNASMVLEGQQQQQQLLQVDKQEGVHIGGTPEFLDVSVFRIHGDFFDGCIDDLRISGRRVPLPPAVNSTAWGQASVFKGVERGCVGPSACANISCRAPLSCVDTWRSYHCGCGEGRVLEGGTTCRELDYCMWQPCLNGGTCLNTRPGYACVCSAGFSGQHCHLPDATDTTLKLPLGILVTLVVFCTFLFLLICAFLLHQHHHRRSALRKNTGDANDDAKGSTTSVTCKKQVASPCSHTPNLLELQLMNPPGDKGQPPWTKNPNIADVDVLRVESSSLPCGSLMEKVHHHHNHQQRGVSDISPSPPLHHHLQQHRGVLDTSSSPPQHHHHHQKKGVSGLSALHQEPEINYEKEPRNDRDVRGLVSGNGSDKHLDTHHGIES